jgi:sugar/nucleoside kinase (ribokinase family)
VLDLGVEDQRMRSLAVLVTGVFCVESCYALGLDRAGLARCLREGREKLRCSWRQLETKIGGFPVHAIRSLSRKRVRVAVSAVVPARLPAVLDQFLDREGVDRSALVVAGDGPISQVLRLSLGDGHLLVVDQGGANYAPPLPDRPYDVILANAGGRDTRQELLHRIQEAAAASRTPPVVGLIARGDWTALDWALAQRGGFHVFLNGGELAESLGRRASGNPAQDLARLRDEVGASRVTVTLGARGSLTLDASGHIVSTPVAAVTAGADRAVGAGDTFAATATLALAAGVTLEQALQIASRDAARVVAGRGPASSLSELWTNSSVGRSSGSTTPIKPVPSQNGAVARGTEGSSR